MNNKGQTTVMFSLMIGLLFMFTLTALELGRIYMSSVKIVPSVHSMRSSIMADYNEMMFERYHLLFLDPTYGTGSEAIVEEKIVDYIETSLNGEAGNKFYMFSVDEIALADKRTILDNDMELLKQQIVDYEKTEGLVNQAKNLEKQLIGKESDVEGAAKETNTNAKELNIPTGEDEKSDNNTSSSDKNGKEEDVEDPREVLKDSLQNGVLTYVAPNKSFSKKEYNMKNPPSKTYQEESEKEWSYEFQNIDILKNFLNTTVEENTLSMLSQHTAFASYVTSHFSNGVNSIDDAQMKCEVEYILKGKNNDYDNIEAVINELTWLRMPVNYVYLLTDVEKKSQALTLATTICVLTGTEPMIEVVKYLLLGCWAYGESLYEMGVLLSGQRIPYTKTQGTWYTDLQTLTAVNQLEKVTVGFSYEDYLMVLLAKQCGDSLNIGYARILDVIEVNVKTSYPTFRIKDCVGAMTIQGKISINSMFQNVGISEIYDSYFEEQISYEE